jgi:hypothetical protein
MSIRDFIDIFESTFTLITQTSTTARPNIIFLLRDNDLTHLRVEQWKWETWEEESRARQDQNAHTVVARGDIPSESEWPIVDTSRLAKEGPATSQDGSPTATPSDEPASDFLLRRTRNPPRPTSAQILPTTSDSPIIVLPWSASPPSSESTQDINSSTFRSHIFSSNESSSAPSSVSISSQRLCLHHALLLHQCINCDYQFFSFCHTSIHATSRDWSSTLSIAGGHTYR